MALDHRAGAVRLIVLVALGATIIAVTIMVLRDDGPQVSVPEQDFTAIANDDDETVSTSLTRAYWDEAPLVIAADHDHAKRAAKSAAELHAPLLVESSDTNAIPDTLEQLSTESVVAYGDVSLPSDVETVTADEAANDNDTDRGKPDTGTADTLVVAGPHVSAAAVASARVTGADIIQLDDDPRDDSDAVDAIEHHRNNPIVTITNSRSMSYAVDAIRHDAHQPGGRYRVFSDRRLIAIYGHPGSESLGALGQQSITKTIARVKKLARSYDKHAKKSVQPALEIIASVARSSPGPDDTYSAVTPAQKLLPWVTAAKLSGVQVILDLQPGRDSLLRQAKDYESLLKQPHVGLAIDPEWSLGPHDKPLQKIGSVDASDINEVSDWLAELTRKHALPQKPLVVHQFQTQMIRGRDRMDTSHRELAFVIHADGQGSPTDKQSTWQRVRRNPPKNVHWGWKNFYDKDNPLLSVTETWQQVDPHPDLITYQ